MPKQVKTPVSRQRQARSSPYSAASRRQEDPTDPELINQIAKQLQTSQKRPKARKEKVPEAQDAEEVESWLDDVLKQLVKWGPKIAELVGGML